MREVVKSDRLPDPPGWSQAIRAGGWLFASSMLATDYRSGLAPSARLSPDAPFLGEAMDLQGRKILEDMGVLLSDAGLDIRNDLIRLWQWIPASYPDDEAYRRSRSHWPCFPSGTPYARALGEMVGDARRSSTGIGVRQLPIPGAVLSVDFIALEPQPGVDKVAVAAPPSVPQPKIGYSPATRFGDWVFLAGFGATDFQGDWKGSTNLGEPSMVAPDARPNPYIWLGSEIEAQTEFTLKAMKQIAEAAGSSLERCVKADVTLTHPSDFLGMDRVWRSYFPNDPPARNVVTGAQLVIKGLRVEIALVLVGDDAAIEREVINIPDLPPPIGHAPHAVRAGDFVFLSALLPVDARGAVEPSVRDEPAMPWFDSSARRQTELIIDRTRRICEAAGGSLQGVCKVQAFLDDMGSLPGMLDAWRAAFAADPPALGSVAMGGGDPLLVPGAHVQWDVIAYAPR